MGLQSFAVFAVHLARCIYPTKHAFRDEEPGTRTRREEPKWSRRRANLAMALNIGAFLFYMWRSLHEADSSKSLSCNLFSITHGTLRIP